MKKKKFYIDQKVLLRKNLKMATIVKFLDHKYVVSYYDEGNKMKYDLITDDMDIIEQNEYEIIKRRINTINSILDS